MRRYLVGLAIVVMGWAAVLHEDAALASDTKAGTQIDKAQKEDPRRVQPGDMVQVHYTARLEDGRLVRTTLESVDQSEKNPKVEGYTAPERFGPEEFVGGEKQAPLGLGTEILGMSISEKRTIKVAAEKAFGPSESGKLKHFPCEKRYPKTLKMNPRSYVERFNAFPIQDREIKFSPYLQARILQVTEDHVELDLIAKDGQRITEPFGDTVVRVEGDQIRVVLEPAIGSGFEVEGAKGRVVSTDGNTFTVDFNSPLAGKTIALDIEVAGLVKASNLQGEIGWTEDHDSGLESAARDKKPVVLVLYADWCSWSKKLLNESLQDPRIRMMRDRFVWIRVDSDKEKAVKEAYGQDGFPMVVVLNSKGDVVKKIDGYRDASVLKKDLEEIL